MKIIDRYRQIYFDEIVSKCKGIILEYSPTANIHEFRPFSHGAGSHAVEQLGRIMRQNLLFYCYGEEEIVSHYEQGKILPSILTISELDAKKVCFAHRERLLQVLDPYGRLLFNDALASLG